MSYNTLQEASTYARFACAAYAVQQYEDTKHRRKRERHGDDPDEDIETGDTARSQGACGDSGCKCCGGKKPKTSDDVRQ